MDKLFSAGKEFLESQSQSQSQNQNQGQSQGQNQGQGPSRCSRTPPRRAHGELTEASYIGTGQSNLPGGDSAFFHSIHLVAFKP